MFYLLSKLTWFFATPSNLLPSLAVLGLALMFVGRGRRFGAALAGVALGLTLVGGLSPLANWLILPLEDRFPAFRDDGGRVDGIVVLGGSVLAEPSLARGQLLVNEAGERVIALADLARRHPEARIVFSGGGATIGRDEAPEAAAVARFLGTLGVPADRVISEDRARNTRENAVFSRALVDPKPGERWLLVTSAWHMPRSIGCFRRAGFPVTAYPVDYRTAGPQDRFAFFAFAAEGLNQLDRAAKEWIGLMAYRLAGYTDALFPAP